MHPQPRIPLPLSAPDDILIATAIGLYDSILSHRFMVSTILRHAPQRKGCLRWLKTDVVSRGCYARA